LLLTDELEFFLSFQISCIWSVHMLIYFVKTFFILLHASFKLGFYALQISENCHIIDLLTRFEFFLEHFLEVNDLWVFKPLKLGIFLLDKRVTSILNLYSGFNLLEVSFLKALIVFWKLLCKVFNFWLKGVALRLVLCFEIISYLSWFFLLLFKQILEHLSVSI